MQRLFFACLCLGSHHSVFNNALLLDIRFLTLGTGHDVRLVRILFILYVERHFVMCT